MKRRETFLNLEDSDDEEAGGHVYVPTGESRESLNPFRMKRGMVNLDRSPIGSPDGENSPNSSPDFHGRFGFIQRLTKKGRASSRRKRSTRKQ